MAPKLPRNLVLGLVSGLAVALVVEVTRPLGGRQPLLDWNEVRDLAGRRIEGRPIHAARLELLAAQYNRLADEVRGPLLEAVGGLPPGSELPAFQALDRQGWLDLNIGILRQVLEPLIAANMLERSRLTEAGKAGVQRYLGFILSFLSQRVLGQFDPQLSVAGPSPLGQVGRIPAAQALYLVEPNVAAWEERAGLDPSDLRRWLILHELTHAWQFAAHPWLRDHLNKSLERLITLASGKDASPMQRLFRVTLGAPEQWRLVRELQASMSLVEGYGNLVMDLVGKRVLPSYEQLEAAYQERSGTRSPLDALIWRVTGLELKMQQYRVGQAFAQNVYEVYGMAVLNRAWESPDTLPRASELRDPQRWYRRVVGEGPMPAAAPA